MFPKIYRFEKAAQKVLSYYMLWVDLGPLTRNFTEIRLRGFLFQGTIIRKNQPQVS